MDHAFVVLGYGRSPFLGDALASLAKQTRASRMIIATSTPNDHIAKAAAAHGVQVLVNRTREGIGADWNFALEATDARFVTLAHQDDVYYPRFLDASLRALAESGAALAFTGYQEIDDAGAAKESKISRVKHAIEAAALGRATRVSGLRLRAFLSFGNPLPCSSVTYDRDALKGFRFSADYKSNLDWDAWWRLMAAGVRFAHVPERLVGRRHNALTETAALTRAGVRAAEDAQMFRRAWPRPFADALHFAYRAGYQGGVRRAP
jgi:glycosyltransferase involved in cell wall biosynthesis